MAFVIPVLEFYFIKEYIIWWFKWLFWLQYWNTSIYFIEDCFLLRKELNKYWKLKMQSELWRIAADASLEHTFLIAYVFYLEN